MDLGVDQKAALDRVNQMTHKEITALNGQITQLPAEAGMGTTHILPINLLVEILL